ncbi:MAG: hypothetical protein K2O31_03350 [Clostridia bacterium]|nr:hypothetical protein [Clostridia bacterium]
MENNKNYFVRNMLCIILIAILVGCVALCSVGMVASAATDDESNEAVPFGIMTKISLDIGSSGTTMWARAHNDFTLGPSTIQVYVYLYSSTTYQEDYMQMTLESSKYIGDLNINKTLETTAQINGVQRYWRARVKYKLDQKDWVSMESETHLVDVNGNVIR